MSMSKARSGKGLSKEPRKKATAPPHSEPTGQRGTGNDPQLREGVWAALTPETGTGAGLRFSTSPKNVPARTNWVRLQLGVLGSWEAGTVLASMGLCLLSQAPGLALGSMPAESREESLPTNLGSWRRWGKEGTSKPLPPQEGSQSKSKAQRESYPTGKQGARRGRRTQALQEV